MIRSCRSLLSLTNLTSSVSFRAQLPTVGYVPDGMSPEQYKKLQQKEASAKANKRFAAFGPQTFKSRSLKSFQEDLEVSQLVSCCEALSVSSVSMTWLAITMTNAYLASSKPLALHSTRRVRLVTSCQCSTPRKSLRKVPLNRRIFPTCSEEVAGIILIYGVPRRRAGQCTTRSTIRIRDRLGLIGREPIRLVGLRPPFPRSRKLPRRMDGLDCKLPTQHESSCTCRQPLLLTSIK